MDEICLLESVVAICLYYVNKNDAIYFSTLWNKIRNENQANYTKMIYNNTNSCSSIKLLVHVHLCLRDVHSRQLERRHDIVRSTVGIFTCLILCLTARQTVSRTFHEQLHIYKRIRQKYMYAYYMRFILNHNLNI